MINRSFHLSVFTFPFSACDARTRILIRYKNRLHRLVQPALFLCCYVISTIVNEEKSLNLFLEFSRRFTQSGRQSTQGVNSPLRPRSNLMYHLLRSKFMNSSRVLAWLNAPQKSDVVVTEFCFLTPRICMHRCCASTTTITPSGLRVFCIHSFICSVSLSCTCKRRENTSTTRAILLKPVIYPFGIYAT